MRRLVLAATAFLLLSCKPDSEPRPAEAAGGASPAAATMVLNGTTWEFEVDGKPTVITIDEDGTYIENRLTGEHVVHGTYRQVGGKDCFTSAMGEKKTSCWTAVPPTGIGESASARSDRGYSAVFRRVAYRELTIADRPRSGSPSD